MKKLRYISELKGIAIAMVILVHLPQNIPEVNIVIGQLTRMGRWGCQLFFVISGYLTIRSWTTSTDSKKKTTSFLLKRFFVIAPAYYFAIVFYQLLRISTNIVNEETGFYFIYGNPLSILANFFMVNTVLCPETFNNIVPGGWYIGTQWVFYLAFPLTAKLYDAVRKKHRTVACFMPLFALGLSFAIQLSAAMFVGNADFAQLSSFMHYSPLNQWPCFLMGISLYYAETDGLLDKVTAKQAFISSTMLGLLASAIFYLLRRVPLIYVLVPSVFAVAFSFLFVFMRMGIHFIRGKAIRRFLINLGNCSYAAYYTNFIFAMLLPWILAKVFPEQNGNIMLIVLLVPAYAGTYVSAKYGQKAIGKVKMMLYSSKLMK